MKYVAQLTQVREVTLRGAADLTFWTKQLQKEDLHPTRVDGQAQILLSAVDSRFMGVPFRELSISVFVSRREDGAQHEGFYLVHAFNSSRFFAFVERTFFHTPYHHAGIQVDSRLPASFQVSKAEGVILRAEMSAASGKASLRSAEECWQGPIFLPSRKSAGKMFFAKLSGYTQTYAFSSADGVTLKPSQDHPIVQSLIESRFVGKEWIIRGDATHAKSKTVARAAIDAPA